MAINLGDVNFGVGADLTNLQNSVRQLQAFSRQVDAAQASLDATAAAMRRQEKAAGDAFIRVQNLTSAMGRVRGTEQYINAANNAFSQFNATVTRGALSALEMQRAQERLRVSLSSVQNQFRDFTAEARRASMGANGMVDSLRNLQASAVFLTGPLGGIATRISAFTAITRTAGFAAAAFTTGIIAMGAGLGKIGMEANRVGAQMKGWESGFKAITGSSQEAAKEISFATKTAQNAGTRLTDTITAYTRFSAAAEGTSLQGAKARDIFEALAKTSSILNMNAESTIGSFRALEQMISKGTVQAEELRGQLGDRLPGAFQIAARAMGVTTAKLGEMMKKGDVLSSEFLPKFAAELRRTFNIPTGPVDTYAAAIGRMHTAYEQLMIAINEKFDITGKVQAVAEAVTRSLDWIRTNLDDIVASAAVVGSALITMLNPLVGLPLMTAALMKFGDQFQVIAGEAGTLKDYMSLVWEDITAGSNQASSDIANGFRITFDFLRAELPSVGEMFGTLGEVARVGFNAAQDAIDDAINNIIHGFKIAWDSMAALWPMLPAAIASGVIEAMNTMIRAVNSGLSVVAAGVNSLIAGFNALSSWANGPTIDFEVNLEMGEIENTYAGAGAAAAKAFDDAWVSGINSEPVDYMGKLNKGLEAQNNQVVEYVQNLRTRANEEAKVRNYVNDQIAQAHEANKLAKERNAASEREARLQQTLAKFGEDAAGGGSGKGKKGAAKALERRMQAIQDMEEAIKRVDEEIEALGGSEASLKALNEEFKRRDEVEKYAKALRKAGVDSEYIKQKTTELYNKLKERDALRQAQQGMQEWTNALSKSVDFLGESLVDLAFDGKDAFKSIGEAARNLAKDLINTFIQLSLTNPLKNALFGMSQPTMPVQRGGGGFGSLLSGLFGGLFGGGGTSYFPPAPVGLWRKGGVSPYAFGQYDKAANGMITKPTFLDTPGGVIQAGEAGTEAIMPLARDSSGSLGVRATVPNSGNVTVNVYAPEGSKVNKKQTSNQQGDSIIDIFIEQAKQAVASDIAAGGTAMNKSLEGRYGLAASSGLRK
jgi:tape measure domain-containing protein